VARRWCSTDDRSRSGKSCDHAGSQSSAGVLACDKAREHGLSTRTVDDAAFGPGFAREKTGELTHPCSGLSGSGHGVSKLLAGSNRGSTRCATIWNVVMKSSSRRWRRSCVPTRQVQVLKRPQPGLGAPAKQVAIVSTTRNLESRRT